MLKNHDDQDKIEDRSRGDRAGGNAGIDHAARSWAQGERGYLSTWGPPIYPLKTVIPVAIGLLMIQVVSETIKSLHAAFTGRWPPNILARGRPSPGRVSADGDGPSRLGERPNPPR